MIEIRVANLNQANDARALVELLDAYARDPMGGGEALSDFTREHIASTLAQKSDSISLLAFVEDRAVGLCNAFETFSTFACQPILNIHDVYVKPEYRHRGIASDMMLKAEQIARERHCCKMTLEVLQGNQPAQKAYQALGYQPYQLDEKMGSAEFWQKSLT